MGGHQLAVKSHGSRAHAMDRATLLSLECALLARFSLGWVL